MSQTDQSVSISAKNELWRRGNLYWKCHAVQKEMYTLFYDSEARSTLVWLLARQTGKSYLLAILALEHALRTKDSIVKMVTDTKTHVETIFEPIFKELLQDCPEEFKPEYNKQKFTYTFYNGSQIQLAGTDNKHYEKLRGQKSVLVLADECGFCDDLDYVIKSVLFPTTTHTKGKIVLASTPPIDPEHEFLKFIEIGDEQGRLVKKTIYDNPLLSTEDIDNIIKQQGGADSESFRREYLCEIIRDSKSIVIPEFNTDLEKEVVKSWTMPVFYDSYVSMDLGGKDLTVVLFGYYDFSVDKVIIQSEIVMDFRNPENSMKRLSELILKQEETLWYNHLTRELKKPYLRVSDINYIAINDLLHNSNYQLVFQVTKKDVKTMGVNMVRDMINSKRIIIDPSCTTLIRHLKNAKWRSSGDRGEFARSADNGHFDALDALIYFVRSIVYTKNPYPKGYGSTLRNEDKFIVNEPQARSNGQLPTQKHIDIYKTIFGVRKKS